MAGANDYFSYDYTDKLNRADEALKRWKKEQATATLRPALVAAEGKTAEGEAQDLALSKSLNVPSAMVSAAPDFARQAQKFNDIASNDILADWAQRGTRNATFARDDTNGLLRILDTLADASEKLTREVVPNAGRQLVHGAADVNKSLVGAAQGVAENTLGTNNVVTQYLNGVQRWIDYARPADVKADSWLGQLGYDFIRSAPQMFSQIGTAVATGGTGSMAMMAAQIAGGSYADLREQGVSPERALDSAIMNAGMQAPLEKLGLDKFLGIFKSQSVKDTVMRFLGAAGAEGLTEFVQKYPEFATNIWGMAEKAFPEDTGEQLKYFAQQVTDRENLAEATKEGVYEGLIGAMWGGAGGAVRLLSNQQARTRAQRFAESLTELKQVVDESKTGQLSPDVMEDFLKSSSTTLGQNVVVPVKALLDIYDSGVDISGAFDEFSNIDGLRKLAEETPDADIPTTPAALLARLDTEGVAKVAEVLKETPNAPSVVELLSMQEEDKQEEIDAVYADAGERAGRRNAFQQEEARLTREMTPHVGAEAAEQYVKLMSAQAKAFEYSYGVSAVDLMRRRSVEFVNAGDESRLDSDPSRGFRPIEGVDTLGQSVYHGSPYDFDSFSLDHLGKGEGAQAHGWGLYFAQDRGVSDGYKEAGSRKYKTDGQVYKVEIPEDDVLLDEQKNFAEQPPAVQSALLELYKSFSEDKQAEFRSEARQLIRHDHEEVRQRQAPLWQAEIEAGYKEKSLQAVALPVPEGNSSFGGITKSRRAYMQALDRLSDYYTAEEIERLKTDSAFYDSEVKAAKQAHKEASKALKDFNTQEKESLERDRSVIDGLSIEELLARQDGKFLYTGLEIMAGSPQEASRLLAEKGIKGITYDGNRDGRCFVVFDDTAVSILEKYYQTETENQRRRAEVEISKDKAIIRLFKGSDLSSIAHESAHIFLDDLLNVAGAGDSIVLGNLTKAVEKLGDKSETLQNLLAGEVDKESVRKALGELDQQIAEKEQYRDMYKEDVKEGRKRIKEYESTDTHAEGEAYYISKTYDSVADYDQNLQGLRSAKAERKILVDALRQIEGRERAFDDVNILCDFAEVPHLEEGLTDGQKVQLQETAAKGFEQYLSEGKAPSKKLEGVFSRFFKWLKGLYASFRDYVGMPLTDEVRQVYDRMLSFEAESKTNPTLEAAFGQEEDFLLETELAEEDKKELDDMLAVAEGEAVGKKEIEREKKLKAAYKEFYKEALAELDQDVLVSEVIFAYRTDASKHRGWRKWQDQKTGGWKNGVGSKGGGINRKDFDEYLGTGVTDTVIQLAPWLINIHNKGASLEGIAQEWLYPEASARDSLIANEHGETDWRATGLGYDLGQAIYDWLVENGSSKEEAAKKIAWRRALEEVDGKGHTSIEYEEQLDDRFLASDDYGQYLEAVDVALASQNKEANEKGELAYLRKKTKELEAEKADAQKKLVEARTKLEQATAEFKEAKEGWRASRKAEKEAEAAVNKADKAAVKELKKELTAARNAAKKAQARLNRIAPKYNELSKTFTQVKNLAEKFAREVDEHRRKIWALRQLESGVPSEQYFREHARKELATAQVGKLNFGNYTQILRKSLSARNKAAKKGDFLKASTEMRRARYAFALLQEARLAKKEIAKIPAMAKKMVKAKPGTYPGAQTEGVRKVAVAMGFVKDTGPIDAIADKLSLKECVAAAIGNTDSVDVMPTFDEWLLQLQNPDDQLRAQGIPIDWNLLTVEEARQVGNLVSFLLKSGRDQSRNIKASLQLRIDGIVESAVQSMSELETYYGKEVNSVADKLNTSFTSIDTLEWQCRKADAFQNVPGRKDSKEGVMEREILNPLREAMNKYQTRLQGTYKAILPHITQLMTSAQGWCKEYGRHGFFIRDEEGNRIEDIPEELKMNGAKGWTSEMVMALAFNLGNAGNRERLRNSFLKPDGSGGISYNTVSLLLGDDAAAVLFELDDETKASILKKRPRREGLLSAEDWKAVQGVWDVFGSQWEDTQKAHTKMYGFAPAGVDAASFAVTVKGQRVNLAGGYYPIKYDRNVDSNAQMWSEKDEIMERSEGIAPVPAARKGHTMGRVSHTGRPLDLSVGFIDRCLVDSARFIELGNVVRFADKVTQDSRFAAEYTRAYGREDYRRIRPNLKGMVVDDGTPTGNLYRAAEKARQHLTFFALAGNMKVAAIQMTAVFPAMGDIGISPVLKGLAQLCTGGMGMVRDVWQASPYMERRFQNIDQDLARRATKFKPDSKMQLIRNGKIYNWDTVANIGMMPISIADTIASTAIWLGAYHKKLAELQGHSSGWKVDTDSKFHSEAVQFADKTVAASNPDNDALSRSAFGRDKGIARLFNIFTGATVKFAQRTRYAYQGWRKGEISGKEFAKMEMYDLMFPSVAMVVMLGIAQGLFSGDDDDNEKLVALSANTFLGQAAMLFPVWGNTMADLISCMIGTAPVRRGGLSSPIDTPIQLAKDFVQGVTTWNTDKLLWSTLDVASFISRIPIGPVARRASKGLDQWEEGDGTPFSIFMPRSGK